MALSETPDLLTGTKGTVFLRRFPQLPALRKIVFKERGEQLSFWWYLGIPQQVPPAPGRHTGLPRDETAEGTKCFFRFG